jgi:hypothetical protein
MIAAPGSIFCMPLGECYATDGALQSGSTLRIQIELGNTGKNQFRGVQGIAMDRVASGLVGLMQCAHKITGQLKRPQQSEAR